MMPTRRQVLEKTRSRRQHEFDRKRARADLAYRELARARVALQRVEEQLAAEGDPRVDLKASLARLETFLDDLQPSAPGAQLAREVAGVVLYLLAQDEEVPEEEDEDENSDG